MAPTAGSKTRYIYTAYTHAYLSLARTVKKASPMTLIFRTPPIIPGTLQAQDTANRCKNNSRPTAMGPSVRVYITSPSNDGMVHGIEQQRVRDRTLYVRTINVNMVWCSCATGDYWTPIIHPFIACGVDRRLANGTMWVRVHSMHHVQHVLNTGPTQVIM